MERIRENIRVAVIFGPGNRVAPVWFDWRRRKHAVKEVTYSWQERQGTAVVLHFAVTDGSDLFELAYNTANQLWSLVAVEEGTAVCTG
jgi:hypothetical protein